MRHSSRYFLLGLIAAAIFIIFNCAGYLLINLLLTQPAPPPAAAQPAPQLPTPGAVVSFSTATPAPLVDAPPAPTAVVPPTETPAPLTPMPPPSPTNMPPPRQPVATAAPGQLEIVSHKSYIDSLGWYHIVGEVQNNASAPMKYVEVMAKLYDATATVIGTKLTFTAPDVIFPGGSAPFDIIALRQSQWENIETYTLHVKGDTATGPEQQTLILLNQSSQIDDGLMIVSGQVQNSGQTPVLAKLIVTLYDADHNVINTSWSYADAGIIAASETASFEVKVRHDTDPNNFQYRIQIEEEPVDSK